MNIIKLNATDSTNSYLRRLSNKRPLEDYTTVMANYQSNGKGQMGANWQSEKSKNLIISVFKNINAIDLSQKFTISMVASLSIKQVLEQYSIRNTKIKWPNDILADNKKICGILIENIIKHNNLVASILGIGLNVNQTTFSGLPQATSLRLLTGKTIEVEELAYYIVKSLKLNFEILVNKGEDMIKLKYLDNLFRYDKPSTFMRKNGVRFTGYIKGVANNGNLQVLLEDNITEEFELKEITLLY